MKPTLSVIIPTIGRDSLVNAVSSVLASNLTTEVIVVVDRESEWDKVSQMLSAVSCRIVLGKGKGSAAARNTGMDNATGEYLGFLDDDDIWSESKAESQISRIKTSAHPNLVVCGASIVFNSGKRTIKPRLKDTYDSKSESVLDYLVSRKHTKYRGNAFCSSALLGSRNLLSSIRWNESQNDHDDWQYVIDLVQSRNAIFLVENSAVVEIHQGSLGSISATKNWRKSLNFLTRNRNSFSKKAANDFLLVFIILPSTLYFDIEGLKLGLMSLSWSWPNRGAILRFLAGIVLRR